MSQVETLHCALSSREHKMMNNREFEIWSSKFYVSRAHFGSSIIPLLPPMKTDWQCASVSPLEGTECPAWKKAPTAVCPGPGRGSCWQPSGAELLSLALPFPYILQFRNMSQSITFSTLQLNFQKESIWVVKYRGRERQHSRKSVFLLMMVWKK